LLATLLGLGLSSSTRVDDRT